MSPVLPNTLQAVLDSIPDELQNQVAGLVQRVGVEFHRDLSELLSSFRPPELKRFVDLWLKVDPTMRSAFVAFVVTGDDPDGAFLRYLDENRECQEAVDLAFAAHIDGLQDLGKSLADADRAISQNKVREIAMLISETEKAGEALEDAEDELETLINQPAIGSALRNVQAALSAVQGTRRGLRALVGASEED